MADDGLMLGPSSRAAMLRRPRHPLMVLVALSSAACASAARPAPAPAPAMTTGGQEEAEAVVAASPAELRATREATITQMNGLVPVTSMTARLNSLQTKGDGWRSTGIIVGAGATAVGAIGGIAENNAKTYSIWAAVLAGVTTIATYFTQDASRNARIEACQKVLTEGPAAIETYRAAWSIPLLNSEWPNGNAARVARQRDFQDATNRLIATITGLPRVRCMT